MDTVGFYHVGIVSLNGGNKVCFPWKGLSFCGLMWVSFAVAPVQAHAKTT